MSLLAARLGYARLAEPVRFRSQWEQQASLRLRDGDTSVLAEYDQHGRIHGGDPEQTMDAAAAAYTALSTAGTDTLLMAAGHALRRELNRRIRHDLIALGVVSDGPAVRIADGIPASPGDMIICTRNDHATEAGEPGRTLANGDLLRIEAATREGLIVRRALDADPHTGLRRWTDRRFVFKNHEDAELGYAVTDHAAQGRTVHTALAVITGTEDRQHVYVALTRGTDANHAYVFTASPKRADPAPGPRPAPELARYDKIYAERAGVPVPATAPAAPGTALSVLAAVLDRDAAPRSRSRPGRGPRVPAIADAERRAYITQIAELMDARKKRLGAHAADSALHWAVSALGPVPEHPVARLDWQRRATSIAAWRELSGYHHPADPIGPEPAAAAPDLRAAWHEALAALGPVDGPDVRGIPDGMLLHLRDTYPVETAWAPQWVGDELRQVRDAARDARLTGLRAAAEADAARRRGDHPQATREQERADSYRALEQAYRQRETVFTAVMTDRAEWEAATRQQRQLAVAADTELRRRHPGQYFAPLRSAEPGPATSAQREELAMAAGEGTAEIGQWIKDLASGRRVFADRLADRQSVKIPSEDPDYGDLGQAFPAWSRASRGAILQPPKPEMTPSPRILQRAMDRDADWEAAD
jgi:AAA domain